MPSVKEQNCIRKAQYDYAWSWFEYHAKQRISMFNFFIVGVGLWGTVLARLLVNNNYLLSVLVSTLAIIISFIFRFLDRRNEVLIHIGENILFKLEKEWLFVDVDSIFRNQDSIEDSSGILKCDVKWYGKPKIWESICKHANKTMYPDKHPPSCTHGKLIPAIQYVVISFFAIAAISSCSAIKSSFEFQSGDYVAFNQLKPKGVPLHFEAKGQIVNWGVEGQRARVIDTSGRCKWVMVDLMDGQVAWVLSNYVSKVNGYAMQ